MPKSLKLTILQNAKLKKRLFLENLLLGEKRKKEKKEGTDCLQRVLISIYDKEVKYYLYMCM